MSYTYQTTITREIEIEVEYTPHRACRGRTDGRYGPPLEPDEPAGIEIESVSIAGSTTRFELTEDEEREIEEQICDELADGPDPD